MKNIYLKSISSILMSIKRFLFVLHLFYKMKKEKAVCDLRYKY